MRVIRKTKSRHRAFAMDVASTFQHFTYSGLEPSQAFGVIYGGHFEHRLLKAGRATLEHQRLMLEDVRLDTGSYDFPVLACGAMPRDAVCFGFVAEGAETTRYNAASIEPDEIQLYPQGAEVLYHAAAPSRWIAFNVPEARVQEVSIACTGRPLDLPRHDGISVRLERGTRNRLTQIADDAFAIGRTHGASGISAALAALISRELITGFVEAVWGAVVDARKRPSVAAWQYFHLVLACERLAVSSEDIDVGVDDIARRSGYSRRALELIFKRSVGMPPGRWFLNMRLNGALRDLLTPSPECHVADVATRWGFRHLPRFAEQYRKVFGELPSQTLHRTRR
jgi:AraC-like DNA-binding protein